MAYIAMSGMNEMVRNMIKKIDILKKNKKGITLVELILYLAMVTMIAPMVLQIFVFGYNSYKTGFNYIEQQKKINEAVRLIQRDFELATSYKVENDKLKLVIYPSNITKEWSFSGDALMLGTNSVLDGIDSTISKFEENGMTEHVVLKIKTRESNTTINTNRNVKDTIIAEFSVKYKDKM